ncbi:MAG: signal peptidase I [Clostridia bacterium]|nr:signal peptidase I [Clostridia bacterium]
MKGVLRWVENVLTGILICIIITSIFLLIQSKSNPKFIPVMLGYQPLSILSGSMRPALEPGDMIFIQSIPSDDVQVGDVITFWADQDTLITHRVVEIIGKNKGEIKYKTKGDANQAADQPYINESMLLGKMIFTIPKGGYISKFVRSKVGSALLILIPIVMLTGSEIKRMRKRNFK